VTTATIRQKLYEYIRFANDEQVKDLYTKVHNLPAASKAWWEDKELLAEMDSMDAAIESGEVKEIPWEVARIELLERSKNR